MKSDIVLDARMINHSGIGTYIKSMIPTLIENFNTTLLGNNKTLEKFSWISKINSVEVASPIYSLTEQIELPKKIPSCRLFISPHYNIPVLKIKAVKRAIIIHDVNHLANVNNLSLKKKIYARFMINRAVKVSNKIITVSRFSKNEIIKYTGLKDISIIYCGLNSNEIKNKTDNESNKKVREKYNLPEEYFLFVGSIKPHKNISIVIEAIKSLSESYPEIKLVTVGIERGQLLSNLEKLNSLSLIEKITIIKYAEDDEMPSLYSEAKCLIFPSIYEGFGLPPLEAMICGCPVIASNAASIPEVCGNAVLYFNPYNATELKKNIELVIKNKFLNEDLIRKGYENIKKFDMEKFSEKLTNELRTVISIPQ
jgi:glycosyltransferase involved in cell wall biosynthesis